MQFITKKGMILLVFVLVFPLVTSLDAYVSGEDDIPGISRGNTDDLSFTVSLENEASLDELSLFFPKYNQHLKFTDSFCVQSSCDSDGLATTCVCQSETSVLDELEVIFRYDEGNDGTVDDSKATSLTPDTMPPEFQSLEVEQDNGLVFTYDIKEQSCEGCSDCSGFKELVIIEDSPLKTLSLNSSECRVTGSVAINYSGSGTREFQVIARDRLWNSETNLHSSSETVTLVTDFTKPEISSLRIQKNGQVISYKNNEPLIADLNITVEDEHLDTLFVPLSDIGNTNDITLTDCNEECIIPNVHINTHDISLNVTATDSFNNAKSKLLSTTLELDNKSPVVNDIYTNYEFEDRYYLGKSTTIFADITEENTIIQAYLKQSGNEIDGTCDEGICSFEYEVTSPHESLSFVIGGKDIAGNHFDGMQSKVLYTDLSEPEIINATIQGVGEFGERNYLQSSDLLRLTASVSDNKKVSSVLFNVSEFYAEETVVEAECEAREGYYFCETEILEPINSGYYQADMGVTAYDIAGNSDTLLLEEIMVYGMHSGTPDNFNVDVEDPNTLNRMTASLVPSPPGYKVLVPFELRGGGSGIEILHYTISDCSVDDSESIYGQVFQHGDNPTPDPLPLLIPVSQAQETNMAELTFASGYSGDEINLLEDFQVNCTISIYQRFGESIYDTPETEEFIFDVSFKDSALGLKPGEKIIDKIKKERKKSMANWHFIEDATETARTLEQVCGIGSTLSSLWNVFTVIENIGVGLKSEAVYKVGCVPYEIFGSFWAKIYYGGQNIHNADFGVDKCQFNKPEEGPATAPVGLERAEGDDTTITPNNETVGEAVNAWSNGFPGIRNICGFISCEYGSEISEGINKISGGSFLEDNQVEIGEFNQDLSSWGNFRTRTDPDPKNSLIISAATVCVPGIFYNLEKYRNLQCEYIKCLKESALQGLPTSICERQKDYGTCIAVTGEIKEVVGIVRVVESLTGDVANMVKNIAPSALRAIVDKQICTKSKTKKPFTWLIPVACDAPRAYYNMIDSIERVKGIAKYGKGETWEINSDYDSVCEEVFSDDFIGEEKDNESDDSNDTEDTDYGPPENDGYPYGG